MKCKGQSVISGVLYTLISVVIVAIVLQIGLPYIQRVQEYNDIKNAEIEMKKLDSIINIVASEGAGSTRKVNVSFSEPVDINASSDLILWKKETIAEIASARREKREGTFFKGANLGVDAYETTINDTNVLVMENEHIYIAIRKLSNEKIKLENLVYRIRNKDLGANFNAKLDFYLDNHAGSYVYVTTYFKESGYHRGKAHIVADVNGGNYSYRINFILESGFDFIRIFASDVG